MPQVKAAAIVEILRSGSLQILCAIRATCPVKVAKAKYVRTCDSFWIGHGFCWALVPRTWAITSKTGASAGRRRRKRSALSGCGISRWAARAERPWPQCTVGLRSPTPCGAHGRRRRALASLFSVGTVSGRKGCLRGVACGAMPALAATAAVALCTHVGQPTRWSTRGRP
jgi:hypothetical protein